MHVLTNQIILVHAVILWFAAFLVLIANAPLMLLQKTPNIPQVLLEALKPLWNPLTTSAHSPECVNRGILESNQTNGPWNTSIVSHRAQFKLALLSAAETELCTLAGLHTLQHTSRIRSSYTVNTQSTRAYFFVVSVSVLYLGVIVTSRCITAPTWTGAEN